MTINERDSRMFIEANGATLCVQTLGDPSDPPILLIHGAAASMMGWPDDLVDQLTVGGLYVIRYDHRDTGESTSYPPGMPGYTHSDLAQDAAAILDQLGIAQAHVVGISMGGGLAGILAMSNPDRVLSLTLISTTPGDPDLPPPTSSAFSEYIFSSSTLDWTDESAVVEYVLGLFVVMSGESGILDEEKVREMLKADIRRSTANLHSWQTNHFIADVGDADGGDLGSIIAPTLVVHGDRDVLFPVPHAEAMAQKIPGAKLKIIEDAGHAILFEKPEKVAEAILSHTRQ